MQKPKCAMNPCGKDAASHVTWGESKHQHANLCAEHVADVWEAAMPLMTTGQAFWIQGPVRLREQGNRSL